MNNNKKNPITKKRREGRPVKKQYGRGRKTRYLKNRVNSHLYKVPKLRCLGFDCIVSDSLPISRRSSEPLCPCASLLNVIFGHGEQPFLDWGGGGWLLSPLPLWSRADFYNLEQVVSYPLHRPGSLVLEYAPLTWQLLLSMSLWTCGYGNRNIESVVAGAMWALCPESSWGMVLVAPA